MYNADALSLDILACSMPLKHQHNGTTLRTSVHMELWREKDTRRFATFLHVRICDGLVELFN